MTASRSRTGAKGGLHCSATPPIKCCSTWRRVPAWLIEDAVCLAHQVTAHGADIAGSFQAYQANHYLRTGRVQLTARFYGDLYHVEGVTRELRNMMLSPRTPEQAYQGMALLYNGVDDDGTQVL